MKYLALEHERIPIPLNQREGVLAREAQALWHLVIGGFVREQYFTGDSHQAVLIVECGSLQEAQGLLNALPLVKEGYSEFHIRELLPYDGFGRLFEKETIDHGTD